MPPSPRGAAYLEVDELSVIPRRSQGIGRGLMEPIGVRWKSGKGCQIVHRCRRCHAVRVNRVAEDSRQSDDNELSLQLIAVYASTE